VKLAATFFMAAWQMIIAAGYIQPGMCLGWHGQRHAGLFAFVKKRMSRASNGKANGFKSQQTAGQ
jgi:hypothetical protein